MSKIKQNPVIEHTPSEGSALPKSTISAKAILVSLIIGNLIIGLLIYLLCKIF